MIRIPLILKILAVHLLVLALVIAAIWLSTDFLAADYFMALMKKYQVQPTEVHEMFVAANHRTLIEVGLAGTVVAVLLSVFLTRKILAPLGDMLNSTRRIAQGEYDDVPQCHSRDELGELATSFSAMADSLSRMDRLRQNMIVDVAHELRTPLTNIRGYIEALQDRLVEPNDEVYSSLHKELLRLVRLTEDLLSSAQRQSRDLALRRIDPKGLMTEMLELFVPRFEERGIDVRTSFADAKLELWADGDQMRQILGNLLENCLRFSPDASWVEIAVTEVGGKVRFLFSNPGEGISESDLPWIFEHYYRGDKSRSRDRGGAGIGLAIVKMLVDAHGGTVGAESDAESTRIWIELPCGREREETLPKP